MDCHVLLPPGVDVVCPGIRTLLRRPRDAEPRPSSRPSTSDRQNGGSAGRTGEASRNGADPGLRRFGRQGSASRADRRLGRQPLCRFPRLNDEDRGEPPSCISRPVDLKSASFRSAWGPLRIPKASTKVARSPTWLAGIYRNTIWIVFLTDAGDKARAKSLAREAGAAWTPGDGDSAFCASLACDRVNGIRGCARIGRE